MCDCVFFIPLYFSLVTICMCYQYFDIRDEPPLPSKFCLKKSTRQEEFPLGGSFSLQICFLCLERGNVLPPLLHTPPKKESEEEVSSSVNAAK